MFTEVKFFKHITTKVIEQYITCKMSVYLLLVQLAKLHHRSLSVKTSDHINAAVISVHGHFYSPYFVGRPENPWFTLSAKNHDRIVTQGLEYKPPKHQHILVNEECQKKTLSDDK